MFIIDVSVYRVFNDIELKERKKTSMTVKEIISYYFH